LTISDQERSTYTDVFAVERYGDFSPGAHYAPLFASLAKPPATVLDAGCGTGKGMLALHAAGFKVMGCDLTASGLVPEARSVGYMVEACLWRDLFPVAYLADVPKFDYAYCCDVLEHIPPTFTMLTVRNILAITQHAAFFSIALVPDNFGVWVGKPLHQTVQGFTEWRDQLNEVGKVIESRDLGLSGVYWVAPQ
jgi:2-polyprenyl-3-methyl-5-hydroxy-6-metoxy-1,4-benzoquinol methylase